MPTLREGSLMEKRIRDLLDCLTPKQRDVVIMRGDGLTYGQIALKLGISKQCAQRRYCRAVRVMKRRNTVTG